VEDAITKISDGFAWAQGPLGRMLRASVLSPVADGWFTTRDVPLAGSDEEAAEAWSRVAAAGGVAPDRIVRLTQLHGAAVHVHVQGAPTAPGRPPADAVATNDPDVALVVQVADCVPVLIADREGCAVAAVHAGWRGTAAGAVPAAVQALRAEFGVSPDRLIAVLGPAIGPCCYRVGRDVIEALGQAGHDRRTVESWVVRRGAGQSLDLWSANRDQLLTSGLTPDCVHVAGLCTACHPGLFHSYRRDGSGTGRMAAVVRLRR
jgi:YfiH family protein